VWPLGLPCAWVRFSADLPSASCLLQCTRFLSQDSCNQRTNNIEHGSLVKNLPVVYGLWRLVSRFTTARHLSPSRAGGIQSMSYHPVFIIHFNTILPSQPRSYEWFFPSPFPIKILCTYLLSPTHITWNVSRATWFSHSRNEHMGLVIIPSSPLLPPPPSYTTPITLSIFKYNHLLPRLSFTTVLKIPTLALANTQKR
jgi:hypothetical protein